jgi:hypothetical protein
VEIVNCEFLLCGRSGNNNISGGPSVPLFSYVVTYLELPGSFSLISGGLCWLLAAKFTVTHGLGLNMNADSSS